MEALPFKVIDILIAAVVIISAIVGLRRGLVREVLAIGAWVGAVLATLYGFGHAQAFARGYISPPILADIVVGIALFGIVLTVLSGISRAIGKRVRDSFAGPLDRSFGTAFGLLRGAFIVSATYLVLTMIVGPGGEKPQWAEGSRLLPWARVGAEIVQSVVPFEFGGEDGEGRGKAIIEKIRGGLPGAGSNSDKDGETGYKRGEREDLKDLIEKAK